MTPIAYPRLPVTFGTDKSGMEAAAFDLGERRRRFAQLRRPRRGRVAPLHEPRRRTRRPDLHVHLPVRRARHHHVHQPAKRRRERDRPLGKRQFHVHLERQGGFNQFLVEIGPEVVRLVVHDLPQGEKLHFDEAEDVSIGFRGGDRHVFIHLRGIDAVEFAGVDLALDRFHDGVGVAGRVLHSGDRIVQCVQIERHGHGRVVFFGVNEHGRFRMAVRHYVYFDFPHGSKYTKHA